MKFAIAYNDSMAFAEADLPEGTTKIGSVYRADDGSLIRSGDLPVSRDPNNLGAAAENGATVTLHDVSGENCVEITPLGAESAFAGTGWFGC